MLLRHVAVFGALLLGTGCGGDDDNQDPEGAKRLFAEIREQDYRSWMRAPGYEERQTSAAPHGGEVDIYVNELVVGALGGQPAAAWPEGSIVAKDGWNGMRLHIVAIMQKRSDGWFWAELDAAGEPLYSGQPSVCIECHSSGSDSVRAFDLPQ